jgi:hypothetical protein
MKNTMADLRNHLFAALEGLADTDKPLDIERAKAISQVAQTVIETAKVEVKFLAVSGSEPGSQFFPISETERAERTRRALASGGRLEN